MKKLELNIENELENIKIDEVQNFDSDYSERVLSKMKNHQLNDRKIYSGITSLMIFVVIFNCFSLLSISPKKKDIAFSERSEKINLIINTFSLDK